MKYIINGGIYEVNLKGSNDAEFDGSHPSVIIRSIKNEDMYYIIPLSTYTKDRWEKYRKLLCCKIESSNSIARIDKMQLRHISNIPKRWFVGNDILVLSPTDLHNIYTRISEYLTLSLETSKKEYAKYFENYEYFQNEVKKLLVDLEIEKTIFKISINNNGVTCECDLVKVSHLTFEDVKRIMWYHVKRNNVIINFKNNKLIIFIAMEDKKALTLKEKYDSVNLTEGHKDKTSC